MIDMAFYVYILYSTKADKYYIGQTDNLTDRVERHNAGYETFTSKYRPWVLLWHAQKPADQRQLSWNASLKIFPDLD